MAQVTWGLELSLQQHCGSEQMSHIHGQNLTGTDLYVLKIGLLNIMKTITPGLFSEEGNADKK